MLIITALVTEGLDSILGLTGPYLGVLRSKLVRQPVSKDEVKGS